MTLTPNPEAAQAGVFGRDDLPTVMVHTAQLLDDQSHQPKLGWEQVVLFGDHQRALDKHSAALTSQVQALRDALATCATRLERCIVASGTDKEYAALAVADYRALLAPAGDV